jgi:hypothetical protein
MRRDLHAIEEYCYIGEQALGKFQAPQLEAVMLQKEYPREIQSG